MVRKKVAIGSAVNRQDWLPMDTGLALGERICAVGDVHGCCDQFRALLDALEENSGDYRKTTLVLLGDLMDRGSNSVGALDVAVNAESRRFDEVIPLMGNHEQLLLRSLLVRDDDRPELWMENGGEDVVEELGVDQMNAYHKKGNRGQFVADMKRAFGPKRMAFLNSLRHHFRIAKLLFVHAGIDPVMDLDVFLSMPWEDITDRHWAWIRGPFLDNPNRFADEFTVVHGHSPAPRDSEREAGDPVLHDPVQGKMNLDAESFRSGYVVSAEFQIGEYRISLAKDPENDAW